MDHFLVLMFINVVMQRQPIWAMPPTDAQTCQSEAQKRNVQDERLKMDHMREMGARYVCLRIVLPSV